MCCVTNQIAAFHVTPDSFVHILLMGYKKSPLSAIFDSGVSGVSIVSLLSQYCLSILSLNAAKKSVLLSIAAVGFGSLDCMIPLVLGFGLVS